MELLQIEKRGAMTVKFGPIGITGLPCWKNHQKPEESKMMISEALMKLRFYCNQSFNELTDISSLISEWTMCESINISNNKISAIPMEFSSITALTQLNIANNQFAVFPEVLLDMKSLAVLDISGNMFTELPPAFVNLSNLSRLVIADADGLIKIRRAPADIIGLPCWTRSDENRYDQNENGDGNVTVIACDALRRLRLYKFDNESIRDVSSWISRWGKCERINISNNEISSLPEAMSELTNLCHLNVMNNELNGFPMVLLQMTKLVSLDFSYNYLTLMPESIEGLKNLQILQVQNNNISVIPPSIGRLTNLHTLSIENNPVHKLPQSITRLRKLQIFSIANLRNEISIRIAPEAIRQMDCWQSIRYSIKRRRSGQPINLDRSFDRICYLKYRNAGLCDITAFLQNFLFCDEMILSQNKISWLPSSITALTELRTVDLSHNKLTEFPKCFYEMSNLKSISISSNQLASLPDSAF
eukprot:TRINITY_DN2540_c0_g1_i15.p1 TRINITY_DN2540_c0_g1~~TRINITY_DN2540_c0_g1_i15.p1  ORF type:complete len:474 (+),score=56.51 TRINITY_DN2540_c0_g1_i15:1673-3094(+)